MKRILLPILVGIFLTVLFFALAVFTDGACHCITPGTIFFPYTAIVLEGPGWESIGLLMTAVQFPLYALIIANVKGRGWQTLVFLILLAVHAAATLVGLKVYHH